MKESLFAVFVCVLGCTEQQSLRQSECETNQDCFEEQWCDGRSERCMPTWTIDGSSASDGGSADISPQRDIPTDAGTAESSRIDQRITPDAHSSESNDQSMAFDVSVPMDASGTDASGTDASGTDASGTEVSDAAAATEAPRPDQSIDSDMGQDTAVNLLVDPSFEDDDPNWNIYGGASRFETSTIDGRWVLRMTRRSGAEQRVFNLEPNSQYRLSGWGLSEDEEPTLIGVKNHGYEQQTIQFRTDEPRQSELIFTTGFGTTSATIFGYKHEGEGAGYADKLSLTYVGPGDSTPIWAEEFDGEGSVNSSRWGFEEGFVRNQELQWYQTENAFVQNGYLVIEGRAEQKPNPNFTMNSGDWRSEREFINYTSASINTKDRFSFRYGRLVVRAKVTNQVGTWPAIWTLGTECEWPSNGEVDVMENYGGNILANFAWGTNRRWRPRWDVTRQPVAEFDANWTERFHIWELHWTEQRMQILLDGILLNEVDLNTTFNGTAACSGANPFRQPHYILLNLALGGQGGDVSETSFPTRYLVDYVRVYP